MITLITGVPEAGKTAFTLDKVFEFRKTNPHFYLYVHGVRNLRGISHETIYCRSQLCDICTKLVIPAGSKYVEDWHQWQEPESLVVVDECQRPWRTRIGSAPIPPAVSAFETHRHYGLDFYLITQSPKLIDSSIRALVGKHIHLVAGWAGRKQYEWDECQDDVKWRSGAKVKPYSLPKYVFKHYDSAVVHIKHFKSLPLSVYAVILAIVISSFLIYRVSKRMEQKPIDQSVTTSASAQPDTKTLVPLPEEKSETPPAPQVAEVPKYPDFKPTIEGVPESAPAYAQLLKVTAVPTITACVYSRKKDQCTCYTAQATVYPTSKAYCMEDVQGKRFNPYFVPAPPSITESRADTKTNKSEQLSYGPQNNDTSQDNETLQDNNNCIIKPVMTAEERRACQS